MSRATADFATPTVGQRMKLARLRAKKPCNEMMSILSFTSEAQYMEVENGKSPMEKYGYILGRLAVRFGVAVAELLCPPDIDEGMKPEQRTVGAQVSKQRVLNTLTVADLCRYLTVGSMEAQEESSQKDQRVAGSMKVSDDDDETLRHDSELESHGESEVVMQYFISEREMELLENGTHVVFERWMSILRAFCSAIGIDAFTLVVGV